jgi:general secretion pathway protein J
MNESSVAPLQAGRREFHPADHVCSQHSPGQSGFTLIEVLLAVALLATIGTMVFASLTTTTRLMDASRERTTREQTIRRVLRVMAEEMSLSRRMDMFPWVGTNGSQEGQPADTVAFLTMSDGLNLSSVKESDMIRVVYSREGDRLMRFVRRNLYGLTDESLDQTELASQVTGFNLRYFDGQSRIWIDEWQTTNKYPKALLIEITFRSAGADPWTVREWVAIQAASS